MAHTVAYISFLIEQIRNASSTNDIEASESLYRLLDGVLDLLFNRDIRNDIDRLPALLFQLLDDVLEFTFLVSEVKEDEGDLFGFRGEA